ILKTLGFGEEKIEYVKDRPGHDRRYAIDATKIKKDLGWQPKYDFDQALEETVKWYQGNKDWWQKLKDKKFEDYYKRQYVTR
ncbi:MAG: dTDP-glucose 4,6-dehydratase, partial [Candidatus Curtissbacteria bacterium GW2011_GWA1_40_47]